MKSNYELITSETNHQIVKRTDENGVVVWIPLNPSNSDYQHYLAWLENPEAEHFTPSMPE